MPGSSNGSKDFVHLHLHTEYSLLDGAIRIKDLMPRIVEHGSKAVAITDHGNMHGVLVFCEAAKKHDLKPIIGCEVYVAMNSRLEKDAASAKDAAWHLVLLAQNEGGFRNLLKLVSLAYIEGFYYKPRVDKELLREYSEGLIALSACLKGEVPGTFLREGLEAARQAAAEYKEIFPGRYYLELQSNGMTIQEQANEAVLGIAEDLDLPLVATNDCHYLNQDDYEAHDVLLCIGTAAKVADERRMRMETNTLFVRSPQEMSAAFRNIPQAQAALENTAKIAFEEIEDIDLSRKAYYFPQYDPPRGRSLEEEMEFLARQGLEERLERMTRVGTFEAADQEKYEDRLNYELEVIKGMGFAGYFLIVADFINWARKQGIPVGPGRGSAAGSLVAFSLGITNLDPLPYNLFFERFLNSERISLPDIDVDFCERRRNDVIRYVAEKYNKGGEIHVAQITTFGTMKAKAVVKDVARAYGFSFADADRIAKLIPDDLKMTLEKALNTTPELRELAANDPKVGKLIDISLRLEFTSRHASTHAAGLVISDRPIVERTPVYTGKNKEIVTQWDMKGIEKIGLIKFDFLGLKTMTVIHDALDIIQETQGQAPDLESLPLSGPEVEKAYEVLSAGDTDGIFQLESDGMRRYLRMLKPNCFEDIIAMLALYRPGPLGSGMVEEFIRRKNGELPIVSLHSSLDEILATTYGVIVYQEQVMKIAEILAGYSLGEGDILRRAMGKKNPAEMAEQKGRFLEGAKKNNVPASKAVEIFELMEKFAEYGFNKSHSAAYALISFYTAYLKAYYPTAYMAALMSAEMGNQDKLNNYIAGCREKNLTVASPDVNRGVKRFTTRTVTDKNGCAREEIVYGLAGIKNVGEEAINDILCERGKNGPYKSFLDLVCRISLRKVTKRVLEYLIKSGALDAFGVARSVLFAGLDRAMTEATRRAEAETSGQLSLMDLVPEAKKEKAAPLSGFGLRLSPEQEIPEWDQIKKMSCEKEALGFYLSGHPLMAFKRILHSMHEQGLISVSRALEEARRCGESRDGIEVKLAIVITEYKARITKNGGRMANLRLADLSAELPGVVFPQDFEDLQEVLQQEEPLFVVGQVSMHNDAPQLKLNRAMPLVQSFNNGGQGFKKVHIHIPSDASPEDLDSLKELLHSHPGPTPVELTLLSEQKNNLLRMPLKPKYSVSAVDENFWNALESWRPSRGSLQCDG